MLDQRFSNKFPRLNKIPLEHQVFTFISGLGFCVSIIFIILDYFLFKSSINIILDLLAISILAFMFLYSKYKNDSVHLAAPISYLMTIVITLGWITGRGAGSPTNWSLFSLIGSSAISMLDPKQRKVYIIYLAINMFSLCTFDFFYGSENFYPIKYDKYQNLSNFTYAIIILISQLFIVYYIKISYDKERNIIKQQILVMDDISKELETQNEELAQQNEEIGAQRDLIETTNAELVVRTNELNEVMDEVFRINLNLEEIVEKRTEEVNVLNKELDLFMYRSSHDFRGPMMTLKGITQVAHLLENTEDQTVLWNKVQTTVDKVDQMLNKFVMISEINYSEELEVLPLSETIDEIVSKYAIKLQAFTLEKEITVKKYPQNDQRNKLIGIIIENTLENAIQYVGSQNNKSISLKIKEEKQFLSIQIKDNGMGIPKDLLPKVKDMYYRGNENSTGNGLGLHVAQLAAKKLNGDLKVESKISEYTLIKVEFPI